MRKILQEINKRDKFLVTAHVNLEGDSLGSQLAMKSLLESMGKICFIVDSDPVPEHYKFLPGAADVSNKIDKELSFDAIIVLDCPTMKRIGRVRELVTKDKFVINIDHHISNEKFGDVNWVDPNASSAGEMVYKLFKEAGASITKEAALSLYIAILTDTGSFNYDNTSAVTHEIASELLGYGLDPASVSENVYEKKSLSDIKFLGMALSTIKLNSSGEIAYMEITEAMMKETGSTSSKSEGFVNYARSIDSVRVAALFRQEPGGIINVSFRSKGDIDVNRIASSFGGGGHVRAAGCVIKASLSEAKERVLAKIEEVLRK